MKYVAIFLVLLQWVIIGGFLLQRRADRICNDRAWYSSNITLCNGPVHAVVLIGDIECECGK